MIFIFFLHFTCNDVWVCVCDHLCLTLCDPMDCSLPGSSVHGIFQARLMGRVAISYLRGFSWVVKQEKLSDYDHSINWFIRAQTEVLIVHILFPFPWYFFNKDTCKINIWNHVLHYQYQFSHSVVSDSLWPYGLKQARSPRTYSNSCPSHWWCHPTISSSVVTFSSCLQYFPASGSFPVSQLFASGGQCIGVSASASVLPMNTQDWFPYHGLVGSPCSPRDSQESSPTPQFQSINSSTLSFLYSPTLTSIHDHWKNHSLD